jgi:hypothetical protein
MPTAVGSLRRRLLGISAEEATVARRGFHVTDAARRERLERIGRTFLHGYHAALEERDPDALARRLDETVEPEWRGFAFEGAAMGLAIGDAFLPRRRRRLPAFVTGAGAAHVYMLHVGAGWALARLGPIARGTMAQLDPLLRWLALDGYGFHEGYFHWPRYVGALVPPPGGLRGYERRAFDQGLGRSLWFVRGADVGQVAETVAGFPARRRADLWSGVGLACAYAGGASADDLPLLRVAAADHAPMLAQGAAFAAEARRRAGNPAPHTSAACEALCGCAADRAADLTQITLAAMAPDTDRESPDLPRYERWRVAVQRALAAREDAAREAAVREAAAPAHA